MVLCKFFREGTCRYGSSCRFEHSYNSKYTYYAPQPAPTQQTSGTTIEQIVTIVGNDVRAALGGQQWMLSCYGPFYKKNFPGFTDVSPEEARLAFYEAKENNTLDQAIASYNNLLQEAISKYRRLQDPDTTIINTVKAVYQQENAPNPFGGSSSFSQSPSQSTFGGHSTKQNIFGGQSSSFNAQSVFGAQNNTSTPSVFGGHNSSSPQSVFGGQTNAQTVFGRQNNTSPQSVFGGQNNTPTAQSVFGGQSNSQSVFGGQSSAPNAQSVFGTSSNAQSVFSGQVSASSVFGGQPSPQNMFGQASSQSTQRQSVFAQANQSAFGSPQTQSVFGSQQTFGQQSKSPFSQPQENVIQSSQSPFSNTTQFTAIPQNQSVGFGQQATGDTDTYSKIEDLSPEDLGQYAAESFEFGFIPELPPPQALCF